MCQITLDKNVLQKQYDADFAACEQIVKELEVYLEELLSYMSSNLTIKGRVKSFQSFFKKYLRYLSEISGDESPVIPDQIGIRIVCPFIEDINSVEKTIKNSFELIELERKGSTYSFKEFGYESLHFLVRIPDKIGGGYSKVCGGTFVGDIVEIQVRTILQDAWAEVEHELVYKAEFRPFDYPMKRKLAAINASLSLADTIFQEIRTYQRHFNEQLGKRKESFYDKVEQNADSFLLDKVERKETCNELVLNKTNTTIDDLLLNALYSHNRGNFSEAISYYSNILSLTSDNNTSSLIHKHRGMAFFAQSLYEEAIKDFNMSFQFNEKSYQAAYYCGVVRLVLQQYEAAIDDFTASIKINAFQPYCFYRRAEAYYHLEDYPQALSDCEAALALEHDLKGALKLKNMLLSKLKM
ncbi:MAG: tetratricopeptide repeat protein [Spirochaetaceae bacterium]|jgi:putative GTP pyrophosphokinase|nr:tetratricopeptide repeat protein [Spirochaetaceae bacterium]